MFCIVNMYIVLCILDVLYYDYVYCPMHFGCSVLLIYIYTVVCILDREGVKAWRNGKEIYG
jgi:hypothetical protein